jgi:LysM domain
MFAKALAVAFGLILLFAVLAHSSGGAGRPRAYTVEPGDTLWSIVASRYAGDPREAIDRVRRTNRLRSALLRPGQRLVLP